MRHIVRGWNPHCLRFYSSLTSGHFELFSILGTEKGNLSPYKCYNQGYILCTGESVILNVVKNKCSQVFDCREFLQFTIKLKAVLSIYILLFSKI